MKRKIPSLVTAAFAALLLLSCSHEEHKAEEATAKNGDGSTVSRGTNGWVIVRLATERTAGIETTALVATNIAAQVRGFARVVDVSPLATLLAESQSVMAGGKASAAEFQRLKALLAQTNAAVRAVQAAEAAADRDRAQAEAARLKIVASWGPALVGQTNLPLLVSNLVSGADALLEVRPQPGEHLADPPQHVTIRRASSEHPTTLADLIGPVPFGDPQLQTPGFFYVQHGNSLHLAINELLVAWLGRQAEAASGVIVPADAIVRFSGSSWVYRQTSTSEFQRVPLKMDEAGPYGWFVTGELRPGDKVVSVGAGALLSEEMKEQITAE